MGIGPHLQNKPKASDDLEHHRRRFFGFPFKRPEGAKDDQELIISGSGDFSVLPLTLMTRHVILHVFHLEHMEYNYV